MIALNDTDPLLSLLMPLLEQTGLSLCDRVDLQPRSAAYSSIPPGLHSSVRDKILETYGSQLYSHQSAAIAASIAGKDLCVSTSTASGKTLIYLILAGNLLAENANSRILALYPTRALIQDQLAKWKKSLVTGQFRAGVIDGSVPIADRPRILGDSNVLLMTPDVCHAWLLPRSGDHDISAILHALRLVVLDEAHVYDGVFGTNMAFLFRRLDAIADGRFRLIATTATIGRPEEFMMQLTGRSVHLIRPDDDGSPAPHRTLLAVSPLGRDSFAAKSLLLRGMARLGVGRFLAFGDSRLMVERLVVAARRESEDGHRLAEPLGTQNEDPTCESSAVILPYRAGYESQDREEIQDALASGGLSGVVSTSALELGLDIGEIDLVILLNPPSSAKAFWQRVGRMGRRAPGVCLLIDDSRSGPTSGGAIAYFRDSSPEPNWLYLGNRYLQYANALCASQELASIPPHQRRRAYHLLPPEYQKYVENELDPKEAVPDDLYSLKQRGHPTPHLEFPLRTSIEPNFRILAPSESLGVLTFGQMLREAYPGAVYFYMAKAYRVLRVKFRAHEITVKREKPMMTKPAIQTMVFPRFGSGVSRLLVGACGFLAEVEVQVSERVIGFNERRGSTELIHSYGKDSPYSRSEIRRFFPTTGVCWSFRERSMHSESIGSLVMEAFTCVYGIRAADLGIGLFHSNTSPLGNGKCQGICVYDSTHGSLRLTKQLAENFRRVIDRAIALVPAVQDDSVVSVLKALRQCASDLREVPCTRDCSATNVQGGSEGDWVAVLAPGSRGVANIEGKAREVCVRGCRYTPQGLMYDVEHPDPSVSAWQIAAWNVIAIHGESRRIRFNLMTGETEESPGALDGFTS